MKKYLIICTLVIGLIPLNIKAQDTELAINPDSIKNMIIELLKQKNLDFYYFIGRTSSFYPSADEDVQNRPLYSKSLHSPKSVSFVNNTVNLSFKSRETSVSLFEIIKKNNEYVNLTNSPVTNEGLIWGNLLILNLTSQNELIQLLNKYSVNLYWGDFNKIVKDYNTLTVKPTVTEEQRKYIVQANAMNEKKDYSNAIQLFNKAIEINPTAYPAAYFNLALISATVGNYLYAIANMKKYLLLEPEASDARSAQDNIYEWEILMQKMQK